MNEQRIKAIRILKNTLRELKYTYISTAFLNDKALHINEHEVLFISAIRSLSS